MSSVTPTTSPRHLYRALEAKSLRSRSWSARVADNLTNWASTPLFLFLNVLLFAIWILLNTIQLPGIHIIDPYPFGFLTMAVSLEAIVLSIFVLVSQNRAAQIATLREELHLRINLIAEREITKTLEVLVNIQNKMGIKSDDPELEQMLKDINTLNIEHSITEQLQRANKQPFSLLSKNALAGIFKTLVSNK